MPGENGIGFDNGDDVFEGENGAEDKWQVGSSPSANLHVQIFLPYGKTRDIEGNFLY